MNINKGVTERSLFDLTLAVTPSFSIWSLVEIWFWPLGNVGLMPFLQREWLQHKSNN